MTERYLFRGVVTSAATAALLAGCGRGATSGAAGTPSAVMAAAAKPAALAAPTMPAGVTPAMLTLGDSLFNANACSRCHGKAGARGQNGPTLVKRAEFPWLHSAGN